MANVTFNSLTTTSGSTSGFWRWYGELDGDITVTADASALLSYSSTSTSAYQFAVRLWKLAMSVYSGPGFGVLDDKPSSTASGVMLMMGVGYDCSYYNYDTGKYYYGPTFTLLDGIGNAMYICLGHSDCTSTATSTPPSSGIMYVAVNRGLSYS